MSIFIKHVVELFVGKMAASIMLGLTALGGFLLLFSFFTASDATRMAMLVSGLGMVFAGILFGLKK